LMLSFSLVMLVKLAVVMLLKDFVDTFTLSPSLVIF
jgi:hypothetical protein